MADESNDLKGVVDEKPLNHINLEHYICPNTVWPGNIASEAQTILTDAIIEAIMTDADVGKTLTYAENAINNLLK